VAKLRDQIRDLFVTFADSINGRQVPLASFYKIIDYFVRILFHKEINLRRSANSKMLIKKYKKDNYYDFEGIKLPILESGYEKDLFELIFWETLFPFLFFDNHFYPDLHLNYMRPFYGIEMPDFNVVVEEGDIVLDVGSWIGDFAAYAVKCGATVYAFEPTFETYKLLLETATLNPGINPINLGLGDKNEELPLFIVDELNTGSNTVQQMRVETLRNKEKRKEYKSFETIKITTIDDFVRENNITRVDFIKADIEGFERNMLNGARFVLSHFGPPLAICTYHLADDPEVLERIILEANPNYRVVHMRTVLFASVTK
jgi:FkbM family methyltransferase